MVYFSITVKNLSMVLRYFDQIKVYRSDDEAGSYTEITDSNTRIALTPATDKYFFEDLSGSDNQWYRTAYYNSVNNAESDQSSPMQGGITGEKIGYTFGNYAVPPGDWGKVYTADDMRYTMMFGIDCEGSDVAVTEWTDEQFDQLVLEAVFEFEAYLTMDIRRRRYRTFGAVPRTNEVRAKLWREGVDFTDEDEAYDFDPSLWGKFGFVQLRHWPVLSVFRAKWYSPVRGEIMDMVKNNWLRVDKQFGQIRMFPQGGFSYGPYSVYGPLWTTHSSGPYPQAFEFDYETGFETAEFIPEGLRGVIAKYATIKALAVIGDGLLAGFSSQSISLDGLSESFSSTQSATSAYFGARIKEYSDEISDWLKVNRYKFSNVPISFVGA